MKQILLLICCGWLNTTNAQITLNGNLLTDTEKPVPGTKIGVAAGPSNFTDSKGQFSIKLSLDFIEGERVFLVMEKPDWVINYPSIFITKCCLTFQLPLRSTNNGSRAIPETFPRNATSAKSISPPAALQNASNASPRY